MEKFKEKKIVNILDTVAICLFVIFILCLFIAFFNNIFLLAVVFFPISALLVIISSSMSDLNDYSEKFIIYMNSKIDKATTLQELLQIEEEFITLAIENDMYCLKFPHAIRKIHEKILNQIEILKKQ